MSEVTEKLLEREEEISNSAWLRALLFVLFVTMGALFVGEALFGKNSLEVYLALKEDRVKLSQKIYQLKNENATLQKSYFEFKNIMPTEDVE